ncbi:MAG: transcriptional regulator GcvA [Hyphomicrobiales bacterium]|nr:transcriptional regulator GcvA [Hyphomicrobiales bacterium]
MARLPSLDTLRVFSVAARHLSFTKAADELHLTQSAISHRVRALEEELGIILFNRLTRRLTLTPAGQALAQRVERAVADIARAIDGLDEDSEERRLTVTTLPSVASRWLIPRLPRFQALHPEIELQVIADPTPLDLRSARIDVAIRFGAGAYPGCAVTMLMPDRVFPVCAPHLIAHRGRTRTIDQMFDLPLLHDSSTEGDGSGSDWRSWLDHIGRSEVSCAGGQRFSDARLLIDAAALGLGVALVRASLVTDLLADGTLVCPLRLSAPTAFAYYLLAVPEAETLPKVTAFRAWLKDEAAATAAAADLPDAPALTGEPSAEQVRSAA